MKASEFKLHIDCDNDAFGDDPQAELCRILGEIMEQLEGGDMSHRIRDYNGNTVGAWALIPPVIEAPPYLR